MNTTSSTLSDTPATQAEAEMPKPGSVLDLASDLCGCVVGPADLSTNPKYMGGYGK
jgi:hypothetical protein